MGFSLDGADVVFALLMGGVSALFESASPDPYKERRPLRTFVESFLCIMAVVTLIEVLGEWIPREYMLPGIVAFVAIVIIGRRLLRGRNVQEPQYQPLPALPPKMSSSARRRQTHTHDLISPNEG
jgi:hypothetical protein